MSFGLSQAFQKTGHLIEATKACPLRSEAWYELSLQKLSQEQNPLPELDRALRLNPQDAFYWQRRALILIHHQPESRGQIEFSFLQAQNHNPFHAPFYIQEGFYRFGQKDFSRAEALFKKAADLEPVAPLPHFGLALIYQSQGNKTGMRAESAKALILIDKKRELESDPVYADPYRDLFSSEYAKFLFNVDSSELNKLAKL